MPLEPQSLIWPFAVLFIFFPYHSPSKGPRTYLQFQSTALAYLSHCLALVSSTLSRLTIHVFPIFDRSGLPVFGHKHSRVVDEGIDIPSKGLRSQFWVATTPLLHCNNCTCHRRGPFRSFPQSDTTSSENRLALPIRTQIAQWQVVKSRHR